MFSKLIRNMFTVCINYKYYLLAHKFQVILQYSEDLLHPCTLSTLHIKWKNDLIYDYLLSNQDSLK